ncbi:MAG: FTR1 family protein [Elusimicrobiota bacterium]
MFQSFMITFREGLESFLIIAISLSYLKKANLIRLIPAVKAGIVFSIFLSIVAGVLLNRASNQALWEGLLALVAAILVGTMTIHMWKTARFIKRDIEKGLKNSTEKTGLSAWLGVFGFTTLMITREGMETALLLNALIFQMQAWKLVLGCALGILAAASIAWFWAKHGHKINLARFLQVTAVFLFIFVIQLILYAFHELTEAGVLGLSQAWHDATEPFGPEGFYGQLLTYLLVIVPVVWLFVSWFTNRKNKELVPQS